MLRRSTSLALALTALLVAACDPGAGNPSGTGANGQGGNNGEGASSFGDGGNGAGFNDGGNDGQGGGCAGEMHVAQKVPLDLYIMLDQSGSMSDPPANGTGEKWAACTSALSTFVDQPGAAGIGVGIQYFPLESSQSCTTELCTTDADCGAGCGPCTGFGGFGFCEGFGNTDSCLTADYATPDVEIAALPGNAQAIKNSMGAHGPTGGTPTLAALQGAIDHARAWANLQVGHAVVVILATDGDPNSCGSDLQAINDVASAGANGTPPILTFVIGVGGSVDALNGFAAAGGTGQAFMIDQDPNVQQAFLDALNQIQGQAIPCAFLIPQPDNGDIDFGQINVVYTPGDGSQPSTIPRVGSAAECPATGLAWYYDDPSAPTQILLCPSTCSTISQDTNGSVNIVVGCDTVVK